MRKVKIAVIGLSGESLFFKADSFLKTGETKTTSSFYREPGGKGFNEAFACFLLGCDVSFLTAVGNDYYGKACLKFLKKHKIHVKGKIKKENTATCAIETNNKGENKVLLNKGAFSDLNTSDIISFTKEIKNADLLLLTNETSPDNLTCAFKLAEKYHTLIIYNNSPAKDPSFLPFKPTLTIVNEDEAKTIYKKPLDEIEEDNLIVTLGDRGCLYINNKTRRYFPARKVKASDTTGAGDVFLAGIASRYLNEELPSAIEFAERLAEEHVRHPYVIKALLEVFQKKDTLK